MDDEKSRLERKVEEIEVEREREMWRVRGGRLRKGRKMRDEKEGGELRVEGDRLMISRLWFQRLRTPLQQT